MSVSLRQARHSGATSTSASLASPSPTETSKLERDVVHIDERGQVVFDQLYFYMSINTVARDSCVPREKNKRVLPGRACTHTERVSVRAYFQTSREHSKSTIGNVLE